MGLRIARPLKDTQAGNNDILTFACSGMQGYREEMEDAHATILKGDLTSLHDKGECELAFFGVFDGHAGDFSAKFLSARLLETVLDGERQRKSAMEDPSQYKILSDDDTIVNSFLKVDDLILNEGKTLQTKCAGSTAITTFIITYRKQTHVDVEIICCNVGDSRCVFGMDGKVIPLSEDQKPFHEKEEQRIVKAQCSVSFGRVNGQLAVARAFGDFEFKQNSERDQKSQAVVCVPEISRHKFTLGVEKTVADDSDYDNAPVLILACDGLWDVMSNEDSITYFRKNLRDVFFFDNQASIPVEKFKSTKDLWTYKPFKDWSSDDCSSWIESLGPEYNVVKRNNLFQNSSFLQYIATHNQLPKIINVTSLSDAVRRNRTAVDEFYAVDESDEFDSYAPPDLETLYKKVLPKLQLEKARQDKYQEQLVTPPKSASEKLAFICESMLDSAVFDKNSRDNVSVLLVVFSNLPYLTQA